ncbi:MAG: YncE family protein [Terriglobales bacterium]
MKRTIILAFCAVALGVLMGCGTGNLLGGSSNNTSSSSSTSKSRPSGIKKRAYVSNNFQNQVDIINAANDTVNTAFSTTTTGQTVATLANTITAGGGPAQMALTPDKKFTVVFNQLTNTITIITNDTESGTNQIPLPDFTDSFVAAPDNKTLFVAVPNAPVSGQPSGAVEVMDITVGALTDTIAVPRAHRLVLSHNGNKLLAFANNTDQMWVVDTAAKTATALSGFDRPVYAVFSSDDSKAYILSCGPECGGTAARVTVLDVASNTPGASVAVSAATIGFLDSAGNLYVAGTAGSAGKLDVLTASTLAVSKSGVAISDGLHQLMALGSNGKLFIGSRTCNNSTQGCLSIYDTAGGTAVISPAGGGDVTGIEPISGRNVVYVIEGGELRIYDTTTGQQQATQIDIVGKAVDVKMAD